jgi:serine kinase of HPr protein (carbohydrate metabolism regulator)
VTETTKLIYGTCVALGRTAAILQGPSGSGKSDLALRFALQTPAELDAALVADDQVRIEVRDGKLFASPPDTLAGKIEVRGLGIITLPFRREAELKLLVQLEEADDIPRLPTALHAAPLCGIALPLLLLAPFEASANLKLRLALQRIVS